MDADSLAARLIIAVATAIVGTIAYRHRRPYGQDLERLWDLRAKAPDDAGRAFLDKLAEAWLKRAEDAEYENAKTVVKWTAVFAFYVWLLPAVGVNIGQIVVEGVGVFLGPIKPYWLAVAVSSSVLVIELAIVVVIVQSLWVLARLGVPRAARWLWTERGIVAVLVVLLIILFSLVSYAIRTYPSP